MLNTKGFNKDLLFKIILIFGGTFFVVLILRFAVMRDFDVGFSLIISAIVLFLYFLLERLRIYVHVRKKKVSV